MGVFGNGFYGDAVDLFQCGTAQDGAGATEEGGIPKVVAVLQQAVKQLAFVGHLLKRIKITLKRIGREKMVRRLHQRQILVVYKPAHGHLQERAGGNVVSVENGNQLARG